MYTSDWDSNTLRTVVWHIPLLLEALMQAPFLGLSVEQFWAKIRLNIFSVINDLSFKTTPILQKESFWCIKVHISI